VVFSCISLVPPYSPINIFRSVPVFCPSWKAAKGGQLLRRGMGFPVLPTPK
jgi:hypothetical protein